MNLSRVSKKIPHEDYRMTLLAIHQKKLLEFKNEEINNKEKEKEINTLTKKLKNCKDSSEIYMINKQIDDLRNFIHNNRNDYSEYLLKSINYIEDYKNSDQYVSNKGQISKNYLRECHGDGFNFEICKNDSLVCQDCNKNLVINHKEALAICDQCGLTVSYQDSEQCTEFSEEIEVLSPFSYKRINHFKEWISMLLARESSSPPQEVIDKLLLELKKNRIYDKSQVTHDRIREYLKKLGLNKMYEHIPLIIHKICGTEPPKISKELELELIKMFEEIQKPFEKHKPSDRKNFLSYSFCIYKFLQIKNQENLLDNLTLLKSREKLHMQDQLFKKICEELNWPFYPSI